MDNLELRAFVDRAKETGAVRYGDLRRLQRKVLPARITTREEAALLIELDRATPALDRDWSRYFVDTVRDFVVWGMDPAGIIDRDKADWLVTMLSEGGMTRNGLAILRQATEEAPAVDAVLTIPKRAAPRRRRARVAAEKAE